MNLTLTEVIIVVMATMVSKLVLLVWAIIWLHRKAVKDEAWEHENAWDSGWSERDPGYEPPPPLPPPRPRREEV